MSEFSLTLVLQIKTSKIINDMAKVSKKSEKITAFGGIFFVLDKFDSILSSVIDSHLGIRSMLIGYQYSEIIRAIFSVFCCGGDCMEDLNLYLKDVLTERPHTRVPSADTVLRGIEELATGNISYTAEKTDNVYDFNTAEKLNQLVIKLLLATGQLTEGGEYDVDFDHQFLEAEKYDSKRTFKGFDGYSPGVFTIGGLIAYLENRDWNANVRFMQAETHRRFFEMMNSFGIHVRSLRADCGSYSEDIVKVVMEHTDKFYIRAERYAALYEKVKRKMGWTTVEIGYQQYDVQSFPFESFEDVKHCRLVVQRQRKQKGEQLDLFDGEYTYRCILTNDWDMTDEEIILHYNKRGSAEQVFDRQNNDFGWAHLPKSFMNQNTVFLLITAMAANFYRYIVALPLMAVLFGIKATDRVKNFLFRFIAVPAKWIKTARQYKLNIYSDKPYDLIWEHG
jgi:hypothetical protein